MNLKIALTLISVNFLFACAPTDQVSSSGRNNGSGGSHPDESALLWQQTSAEYTALCHQAFNAATVYLSNNIVDQVGEKPRAIVMDLDETVLDNSAYNAELILKGEQYKTETWNKWTTKVEAKPIPGAVEFIQSLQNYDLDVIFISNRDQEFINYTLDNLNQFGIEVNSEQLLLKVAESDKSARRAQVEQQYEIVMFIGDNLADFGDFFEGNKTVSERKNLVREFQQNFGRKFIVLPNPVYGAWKNSLELKDNAYPSNNQEKGRKSYLRVRP